MIREILINAFRFIVLVFLQVFILNNIQFSGFVNPYLYILFVLLLPFETPGWLLLVSAFLLGIVIDSASMTIGYHTVATVFMAYLRYHLLSFIAPHDGYEIGKKPTIRSLGISWFSKYAIILVLVHHLLLFWVESFHIYDLLYATSRAFASGIFTLLLIFVQQMLSINSK